MMKVHKKQGLRTAFRAENPLKAVDFTADNPCAFIFSGKPHTMQFVQTNRSCFGPWSAPLFGRETHIVTVLLLDLGNTALKWTTLDKPEEPQTYVHGGHGTPPDELLRTWSALKPTRVVTYEVF